MLPLFFLMASVAATIMNKGGVPYKISNPNPSTGTYSTDFETNANGPVEYFDVYGEVQTRYSQVYWTRNAPIDLPQALVDRFKGKVMAITGYEVDQVTHDGPTPGKPTVQEGAPLSGFACYPSCAGNDTSIPSYHAYNHHYFSWLTGSDSEIYDREEPTPMPNPTYTGVRDLPHSHNFPTNIVFKENPGGEFRKSYHGYPGGYAQLIYSPTQWVVEPMQIDTHNRNFSITDQEGFTLSFLPKQVQNTMTDYESSLNPLIECPCSDRISKTFVNSSTIITRATCPSAITSETACAAAVGSMAKVSYHSTVSNTSLPAGCIMTPERTGMTYTAIYNAAQSTATCAIGSKGEFTWEGPLNDTMINCDGACLAPTSKYGCTGEFRGQCTWDSSTTAQEMCSQWDECEAFFCTNKYSSDHKLLCFARSEIKTTEGGLSTDQAWKKVYKDEKSLQGHVSSLVDTTIAHDGIQATVTISGPDGNWFGVGFDASAMKDLPYALIVDGAGTVVERKLVDHGPGSLLKSSVSVISNSVENGTRTVVLTRAVIGASADHYTIPTTPGDIKIITAIGSSPNLSYHKARTDATLTLVPTKISSCICAPKRTAYITYMDQSTREYHYDCLDEPRSDMLRHGDGTGRALPNAACQMETYHGGLQCCQNSWFLTDKAQDSMIPSEVDTYYLKWRYYFQEYTPASDSAGASHQHLHHWVFLIDANVNDYEEDNAEYGSASIGKLEAHLTGRDIGLEDVPTKYSKITFYVMTPHCHAPSCIREEFWNADTNELICNVTAEYGSLAYGSLNDVFNEADYVAIPPCIFGHQPGLESPAAIGPDTNITAIKYFNNTYRHLGQMAQWTGLMTYDTDPY